ncbi:MAG: ACT domain-containing protein [Pyrobaculum sp.]
MKTFSLATSKSLDSLGRIIAIMRRAKVEIKNLSITSDTSIYKIMCSIDGNIDEINWLVSKLDKLPEVLKIEEININH